MLLHYRSLHQDGFLESITARNLIDLVLSEKAYLQYKPVNKINTGRCVSVTRQNKVPIFFQSVDIFSQLPKSYPRH
jgi:hypothetical protein